MKLFKKLFCKHRDEIKINRNVVKGTEGNLVRIQYIKICNKCPSTQVVKEVEYNERD